MERKADDLSNLIAKTYKDLADKNINNKNSDTEDTEDSVGSDVMGFVSSSDSNTSSSDSGRAGLITTTGSGIFPRLRRLSCYGKPEIQNKMTFVENSSESSTSETSFSSSDYSVEFETSTGSETSHAKYSASVENSGSAIPRSESETNRSDSDDIEYAPSFIVSKSDIRKSRSDSSAYIKQAIDDELVETSNAAKVSQSAAVIKEETVAGKMRRIAKKTLVYSSAAFSIGLGSWTIRYSLQCQSGCRFDCFDVSAFEKLLELRHL